jgi:hypothetical protein
VPGPVPHRNAEWPASAAVPHPNLYRNEIRGGQSRGHCASRKDVPWRSRRAFRATRQRQRRCTARPGWVRLPEHCESIDPWHDQREGARDSPAYPAYKASYGRAHKSRRDPPRRRRANVHSSGIWLARDAKPAWPRSLLDVTRPEDQSAIRAGPTGRGSPSVCRVSRRHRPQGETYLGCGAGPARPGD